MVNYNNFILLEKSININQLKLNKVKSNLFTLLSFLWKNKFLSEPTIYLGFITIESPNNKNKFNLDIVINIELSDLNNNKLAYSGNYIEEDKLIIIELFLNENNSWTSIDINNIFNRLLHVIIHECAHSGRDSELKKDQKKSIDINYVKAQKSKNRKKYLQHPLELDANITVMIHTYNNLGEYDKYDITVKELMKRSGFSENEMNFYSSRITLRKKIISRLYREGIMIRNWG